jgi:hypothetical protein
MDIGTNMLYVFHPYFLQHEDNNSTLQMAIYLESECIILFDPPWTL